MTQQLRFDVDYRENAVLHGGTHVVLRSIRPTDKQHLVQGLARLSPEARYMRFLCAKKSLSTRELKYLTEIDGFNHFALGALILDPGGAEEGIGVGRLIRLQEKPTVAEPAITVLDEYQGQGLGGLLMRRLIQAARERGIVAFRCCFMGRNKRIRNLLDDFGRHSVLAEHGGEVTMEFPLPKPTLGGALREAVRTSAMYNVFTKVAEGNMQLQVGAALEPHDTDDE